MDPQNDITIRNPFADVPGTLALWLVAGLFGLLLLKGAREYRGHTRRRRRK